MPRQSHQFRRRCVEDPSHLGWIAGLLVSRECAVDAGISHTDTVREGYIALHVLLDQALLATGLRGTLPPT
jgi:hypothetical protein